MVLEGGSFSYRRGTYLSISLWPGLHTHGGFVEKKRMHCHGECVVRWQGGVDSGLRSRDWASPSHGELAHTFYRMALGPALDLFGVKSPLERQGCEPLASSVYTCKLAMPALPSYAKACSQRAIHHIQGRTRISPLVTPAVLEDYERYLPHVSRGVSSLSLGFTPRMSRP